MNEMNETEQGGFLGLSTLYSLSKLIPLRKGFSKGDQAVLQKYGNKPVNNIMVCRTPLNNVIGTALNVFTLGKWEKAVAKGGYDSVFHLFLVIQVEVGDKIVKIVLEKNETPRCYLLTNEIKSNTECKPVMKAFFGSINDLINSAINQMGKNMFFSYNYRTNNCQIFILNILGASNLTDNEMINFIKQDVDRIAENLPTYSHSVIQGITDTARRLRTIVGRGIDSSGGFLLTLNPNDYIPFARHYAPLSQAENDRFAEMFKKLGTR